MIKAKLGGVSDKPLVSGRVGGKFAVFVAKIDSTAGVVGGCAGVVNLADGFVLVAVILVKIFLPKIGLLVQAAITTKKT